jgi:hypothetical protein
LADVTESQAPAPVDFTVHDYDGRMILPLASILTAAREFSFKTFGPASSRPPVSDPTLGVRNHIRRELDEVNRAPHDLEEWMDVAILAFDGAFRAGYTPLQIASALTAKYHKNTLRKWPDWRTAAPGSPIEHVKETTTLSTPPPKAPVPINVPRHKNELAAASATAVNLEE